MTHSKLLTIEDLIDELDMGKATLKFILHRFSPWLVTQIVNHETCYTEPAVTTLLKIKKFLDTGILPDQVEAFLAQEAEMLKATDKVQHPAGNQGTISVDKESVSMFKDLLQKFIEKQDRIALAQETLSRVEERKADAMEKRAAAEEKKADAMTHIALALQEMNQRHSAAPQAMEIAGRAVETLALEEAPGLDQSLLDTNFSEKEQLFEDPVPMEDAFKAQDHKDFGDISSSDMDDLSLLVNETALTLEDIDMDDLSKLVDSDLPSSNSLDNEDDLDDLFSLVGMDTHVPKDFHEDLDDLSKLIEPTFEKDVTDLDDLSALIEESEQSQEPEAMDDLSLLVGGTGEKSGQMPPEVDTQVKETPVIKLDISPDQDMGKYKAAVMKIIIELKGQGFTAQQTIDRFNRDGVATLSGKPTWGLKAMDKIYGFIDSVK